MKGLAGPIIMMHLLILIVPMILSLVAIVLMFLVIMKFYF